MTVTCYMWMLLAALVLSQLHETEGKRERDERDRLRDAERQKREEEKREKRQRDVDNKEQRRQEKKRQEITINIHKSGSDLSVEVGGIVELTCEVNRKPSDYEVRWLFQPSKGGEIQILTIDTAVVTSGDHHISKFMRRWTLTLQSVTMAMQGTFICDVIQGTTSVKSDRIELIVKEPHAAMASRRVGELGELTEFVCSFDGIKPWHSVQWTRKTSKFVTKETRSPGMSMVMTNQYSYWSSVLTEYYNGTRVKHSRDDTLADRVEHVTRKHPDGSTTFHLILQDLSCADNGTFRCSVSHDRGASSTDSRLVLTARPAKPTITTSSNLRVVAGQTITLTCTANVGIPAGILTWYQQQVGRSRQRLNSHRSEMSSSGDCTYLRTSTVAISVSRDRHHAVFTCFASRSGTQPTTSPALARYTLIVGDEDIVPTLIITPNHIVERHTTATIQCSLPAGSRRRVSLLALYRVRTAGDKSARQREDAGSLMAYVERDGEPVLVEPEMYGARLTVRGSIERLEVEIRSAECSDTGVYRCVTTKSSQSRALSVVDLSSPINISTTKCQDVIDDDTDCVTCPFLARVHQDLPVVCSGHVAFPGDTDRQSYFTWSLKRRDSDGFQTLPISGSSILGARPVHPNTVKSTSGCYSEPRTSLFIYRPGGGDGGVVVISCELHFYSKGIQNVRRQQIRVCVRKAEVVSGCAIGVTSSRIHTTLALAAALYNFVIYH